MGRAEGPPHQQGVLGGGEAQDGVDLRGLQGLPPGQIREDGGQAAGQHGLARPGRAHHAEVVAAGGGDLQGALHVFLPLHVGKVGAGKVVRPRRPGRRRLQMGLPPQMGRQLPHALHRVDLQPAGQSGLGGGGGGDVQPLDARPPGGQGHGQHPHHRPQGAGQRQLPHVGAVRPVQPELPPGGQNTRQNGQIVHRAPLALVGGSQVDRDAGHREGEAAVFNGGAHPVPGLLHRRVRQAHDLKGGQTGRQVALCPHLIAGDPAQPQGAHFTEHGCRLLSLSSCCIHYSIPDPPPKG